ncbi:hypothetical protein PybrP1_007177 [[Pythium] brassicae (nom. inval.)]|nr:hypothetical protein PybrP1_007177 [[Pythium] brassicae (nom. inval.)]
MQRNDSGSRKRRALGEHHGGSFGVYMDHKIRKLRLQNASLVGGARGRSSEASGADNAPRDSNNYCNSNSSTGSLFAGVHVYVDGYTMPSKEEIRQLLLLHGGGFEHYETARVTHIVATHLSASKLLQLKKMRKPTPVVHPDWVVQSVAQSVVLPTAPFLYRGFADPTQNSLFGSSNNILNLSASSARSQFAWRSSSLSPAGGGASSAAGDREAAMLHFVFADEYTRGGDDEGGGGADAPQMDPEVIVIDDEDGDGDEEEVQLLEAAQRDSRSKSTRDGAEFVRHFFAKSRLHHIGNWRSTFQQKAGEFLSVYKGPPVQRESPASSRRVILHVDMDCFFVAVAVRGRPELQQVPVAVAHSGNAGTSEISSCNYLARDKGVRAGMFMQAAKELCPELTVLPYQFEDIEQVSFQIYTIFFSHTPYVQAMSCDEALLEFGHGTDGLAVAHRIREEIVAQTRCLASVGVSYNILLAKLASKQAKPDGMYQIESPERAEPFLLSLAIRDLPGVGRRMSAKLQDLGLEDMPQLRAVAKSELARHFGKATSEMLFSFARGTDHRALSLESNLTRKSVSAVVNFGIRFETWDDATVFMMALAEELQSRLQSLKVRAESLTLLVKKRREGEPIEAAKYMGHGVCDNFSRSQVLAAPTDDAQTIGKVGLELLRQLRFPPSDLRGVGIQATKLVAESAGATGRRTRQLFATWIGESAREQPEPGASSVEDVEEPATGAAEAGEQEPSDPSDIVSRASSRRQETTPTPGLSQVSMSVLDELPPWIRDEVLATYRPRATDTAAHPLQPLERAAGPLQPLRLNAPPKAKGKRQMRKPRNALASFKHSAPRPQQEGFASSTSSPSSSSLATANALDDIRMSQIDSDVYDALPFTLRKEIDRHAKKSRSAPSVAAVSRARALAASSAASAGTASVDVSKPLQSIEELFQGLVDATRLATRDEGIGPGGRQDEAFDSIYSRILLEVENHALDHALRMLRYVRRKCQSAAGAAAGDTEEEGGNTLRGVLHAGFNRVLEQVNRDVQQHFRGVFALKAVVPL